MADMPSTSTAPTVVPVANAMPTSYTVRLRHLSDVKPFVLIPNHSDRAVDDLSRCIVSAFPAIVARSQERPDKIKVPGVVAANGATAPLYVLAQNPQLFVGPPFTVLVMGETEVVTTSNPNALPAGWEQRVHPSGKVYFIDHNTKKTSWRDPRLPNAASANEEEAALPTYHSLARIRALQRETHLEDVEMETLLQVFREEAGAGDAATSDEANAATLDHDQFANCLNRLLPTDDTTVDDDRAKRAMVNRVFALFDADNNGVVDIKEFALGMSMLVKGSKEQKLRMAFDVLDADGSGHVSREELLQYFQSLRDVFRESSGISPVGDTDEELIAAVEECFAVADIDGNGAISWDEFLVWAGREPAPRQLRWMETLEKFEVGDQTTHSNVSCNACGMKPIVGIRYACQDCVGGVDLCTACYSGRAEPGNHRSSHTFKEYINPRSRKEALKDTMSLGKKLSFRRGR